MNIYESLKQDHETQRKLLDQLIETTGESDDRKKLFNQVKAELTEHADAEERYFYVPLIKLDSTQADARHGIAEHHEIDELIEQLEQTEFSSSAWLKYAKDLADKVKHHLKEEEQDYFPKAKKVLSNDRAENLGDEFLGARNK